MKKLIMMLLLLSINAALSQNIDDYINLLRLDLKTEKSALISDAMNLSENEATRFWPVYNEYSLQLDRIGDKRVAFIKEFAANYDNMTDAKAKYIIEEAFDFHEDREELLEDLFEDTEKIVGAVRAAKLVQIENVINTLIDLKINSELPIIRKSEK